MQAQEESLQKVEQLDAQLAEFYRAGRYEEAIAVAQRDGPVQGLAELRAIDDQGRLSRYPFYPAAFGELELRLGRLEAAEAHFRAARDLARNPIERRFLAQRISACESP